MNDLLEYQAQMLAERRDVSLDYDTGGNWFLRVPWESLWDDTIDLMRFEAHRLHQALPKKLGPRAVICRSGLRGWHLYFPEADLTWRENEALMFYSRAHRGFVKFSVLLIDCTLRVGEKPGAEAPYIVEVIRFE